MNRHRTIRKPARSVPRPRSVAPLHKPTPLTKRRGSSLKSTGMKPLTPAQTNKVKGEGACRACGSLTGLHGHHVISRSISLTGDRPEDVIPLDWQCHDQAEEGKLDVLRLLRVEEQHAAVDAAGSLSRAYEILTMPQRMAA